MSFQERFYDAVGEYLRARGYDVNTVTSVEQDTAWGCDTCGPEWEVDIYYTNSRGQRLHHTYYGSLDGFLSQLP